MGVVLAVSAWAPVLSCAGIDVPLGPACLRSTPSFQGEVGSLPPSHLPAHDHWNAHMLSLHSNAHAQIAPVVYAKYLRSPVLVSFCQQANVSMGEGLIHDGCADPDCCLCEGQTMAHSTVSHSATMRCTASARSTRCCCRRCPPRSTCSCLRYGLTTKVEGPVLRMAPVLLPVGHSSFSLPLSPTAP